MLMVDARTFANSQLNYNLRENMIAACSKVIVEGHDPVPVCLLGGPTYPLLPYVMKEFRIEVQHLVHNFSVIGYLQQGWLLKGHVVVSKAGLASLDALLT